VVQNTKDTSQKDIQPTPITAVLEEFSNVFEDPSTLPSHREYDHTIPLLPDGVSVNAHPYRYPPLHKDKIERQVRHLLQTGLISPSTSPFASPVFLVQKKMEHVIFVLITTCSTPLQ
jgi:hypothetical protein